MACYNITSVTASGTDLTLTLPISALTIKNGQRACFKICTSLPTGTTILPVVFQIGTTTVPIMDMLGNTLYSDQLKTCTCIPGVWGTNPNHFKLCACVNGKSAATACTATLGGSASA